MYNPALQTLMLLLRDRPDLVPAKARTLFIRACPHLALKDLSFDTLVCNQTFKPVVDELATAGFQNCLEPQGSFDLVLYLPTSHRDENLYNFARAALYLKHTCDVMCAMSNDTGARRFETKLRELFGETASYSKNHCRVFWAHKDSQLRQDLAQQWLTLGAMRCSAETKLYSRPGGFGWNKLDSGSTLLCSQLPAELAGVGADLGAGFGFISHFLLKSIKGMQALHVYEAEQLALELCRINLEAAGECGVQLTFNWHDVTAGLLHNKLDWVVMNPPFHQGRTRRPVLGVRFIEVASQALRRGGQLYMVANSHLPYREALRAGFSKVEILNTAQGFTSYKAVR